MPTIKEKISETPPIARVNDIFLFKEDVQDLFKSNVSEQDSILIIKNYIDSWAKQQLLLYQAEINLEIESLGFEKLVEDYRSTLYINAYKEALVSNKLDTIVSDAQVKQFYLSSYENFKLNEELVQLKYIHFNNNRSDEKKLIKLFKSKKNEDIEELESMQLEFISYNFNDSIWVNYNEVFNKINVLKDVPKNVVLKKLKFIQKEDSLGLYLITVKDVLLRNDTAPISYITPTIKQIILQKRKLELSRKIEIDLLNDAIKNENFEKYKYD
ncbi:MAG: hypothetical protein ACI89R_000501 [Candidatus Azotimanducaceae bacterium]|jgi:hypothetical protein